ncbi:MAG: hypothetical protein MUO24_02260 [Desulfobacterales bacterium]|nr:hypothetical protein [Desulfobacterales bacterium]
MPTDKFDLHTVDYSVQGWDTILAADMEKLDDVIPSRTLALLGETVVAYQALYLKADGTWWKAQADGVKQPCLGIALEGGDATDVIRVVRLGDIVNAGWAWTVAGPIYLSTTTPGAMTQALPTQNVQILGYATSVTGMVATIESVRPASGSGGGTMIRTTVAGEVIVAGDVVGQFRTGIRKGFGLLAGSAEIDLGVASTTVAVTWLTSSLFVTAYIKSADSKVYAMAHTLNADWTITSGAEVTIANYASIAPRVRRGSDSSFVVAWCSNVVGGTLNHVFASACSVGALNAITVGAEADINAGGAIYTADRDAFDFRLLTTLTMLFAFRDAGDSSYLGANVVTWDAGTLALTVNADVRMVTAAADNIALAILSPTRANCYYESAATGFYQVLIKIAGTVPSPGTAYGAMFTAAIGGMDAAGYNDTISYFTCAYGTTYGLAGMGFQYLAELASQSVSGPWYIGNALGKSRIFMANGAGLVIWTDSTNTSWKWSIFTLGWKPLQYQGGSVHALGNDFDADLDPSKTALAMFFTDVADFQQTHLLIYDVGLPVGIAQEANNGGTPLLICFDGLSAIHAGLTPNLRYYMQIAGTLTTTPNGWLAGDALSATELLVKCEKGTL